MSITLLQGDARALPLPDASVDLVVTSPPYFALRSYSDGGEHYAGQLGSEPTPAAFIEALIECTREMVRVLKPTGSIWVNLGDKYATGSTPGPQSAHTTMTGGRHKGVQQVAPRRILDGRAKSLLLLPERYRIACVDQLGLIARAVVIWSKPNGLPESVTDRVRRSHEDWVHLTKAPRYFAAVDEIREPYASSRRQKYRSPSAQRYADGDRNDAARKTAMGLGIDENPLGKLPGSVWEIATQPLTVPPDLGIDHFAAFPMEWPRRIILGWSPAGICAECCEGRRPIVVGGRTGDGSKPHKAAQRVSSFDWAAWKQGEPHRIVGYVCACPEPTAPTRPAVVLDPFGGTGTTALVADVLGRHGISVELSADYCRLATWRTADRKQRERASRPAASKRRAEATPIEVEEDDPAQPTISPAPAEIPIQRLPHTADEWLAYFAAMSS